MRDCLIWNPRFTLFFDSPTYRELNSDSTKGDASVPTLHPLNPRPYATKNLRPRYVVEPLFFEHLTDMKKYVIIISKYSGIYNIPIIPLT